MLLSEKVFKLHDVFASFLERECEILKMESRLKLKKG